MSERLYSLLLRLYPRAFRERYSAEMRQVFRDRLRHEAPLRVWTDVLGDALVSIPRQHFISGPHPYFPPLAAPLHAAVQAMLIRAFVASTICAISAAAMSVARSFWSVPVFVIASGVLLRTLWKAGCMSRAIRTYVAEVGDDSVTVSCAGLGMAPVTLRRADVTAVHVFVKTGLRVQTADPSRDLWVPENVPSYADLKARLSEWAPVTMTPWWQGMWQPPDGVGLAVSCALALLLPMSFASGYAAGSVLVLVWVIAQGDGKRLLTWTDPRSRRFALSLLPAAIVLVRWML